MGTVIPKKLKIYIRGDVTKETRYVNGQKEFITVRKAWVTNAANKQPQVTAKKWLARRPYTFDPITQRNKQTTRREGEIIERDNIPFKRLEIYRIEQKYQAESVYKVRTKEGWGFEVHQECVIDTLIEGGIKRGGHMQGDFIWVSNNGRMKITRIGSKLHQEAVKYMKRKLPGKIKIKDLVVGGVYRNLRGDIGVYMGKIDDRHEFARIWHYPEPHSGEWVSSWKKKQDKEIAKYEKRLQEPHGFAPSNPRNAYPHRVKSISYVECLGQITEDDIKKYIILRN